MTQPNASTNTAGVTIPGTTETTILSTVPRPVNAPANEGILVWGSAVLGTGASTTAVVARIYRGPQDSLAPGLLLQTSRTVVIANTLMGVPVTFLDTLRGSGSAPGPVTIQYMMTLQLVGTTGTGSVGVGAASLACMSTNSLGA